MESVKYLQARADCRVIRVNTGDSCATLASKCGISGNDFMKYNKKSNLCSTLAPGQIVCCSSGSLPDLRPKPNPNGECASYLVQTGDFCNKIVAENSLKDLNELESFNKNTWGWTGCGTLMGGLRICLSKGDAPAPAPISNAICGPQVPGTVISGSSKALADYNPCPLRACCNVWGQCGTTNEFCTISKSKTGAPGTSAPGETGCISNCGTNMVLGPRPENFMKVALKLGIKNENV